MQIFLPHHKWLIINRVVMGGFASVKEFRHGWLVKGWMRGLKTSSPRPLLHKCVEERENTRKFPFMSQPWGSADRCFLSVRGSECVLII
jgi:hypothetical protein